MKFVLLVISCVFIGLSSQNVLKVSIYYETLCDDSIKFITEQLFPCYGKLQKYIYVDFVPYGKVEVSRDVTNGSYSFYCQHGDDECYGNRMHACAISQTENQTTIVKFINCSMSKDNPALKSSISECATKNGLSWDAIQKCEDSGEGLRLFTYNGYRTNLVVPSINFVPTIVYNDRYDENLHNNAITDFCGTTTKIITYLRSIYYPFPWCNCADLNPYFPSQCCGISRCSSCPWSTGGCNGCGSNDNWGYSVGGYGEGFNGYGLGGYGGGFDGGYGVGYGVGGYNPGGYGGGYAGGYGYGLIR